MPCPHCPHPESPRCPGHRHRRYCELTHPRHPRSDHWRAHVAAAPALTGPVPPWVDRPDSSTEVLILYHGRGKLGANRGLGVNADHTAAELAPLARCSTATVGSFAEVPPLVRTLPRLRLVVLQALWTSAEDAVELARELPGVLFLARCHSNVGFLHVTGGALPILRAIAAAGLPNLKVSGVSRRFCDFFTDAYSLPCVYLPNLYHPALTPLREPDDGQRPLRVCSYGSIRVQKHHHVSAAAALVLGKRLGRPVEFHLNSGRVEGGEVVARLIREMYGNLPYATLVEDEWRDAGEFRRLCTTMDVGFQLSTTETFNLVTADLAAANVPSVVSDSIDWMPRECWASTDDHHQAADVAARLLADPTAGPRCRAALTSHRVHAYRAWAALLDSLAPDPPEPPPPDLLLFSRPQPRPRPAPPDPEDRRRSWRSHVFAASCPYRSKGPGCGCGKVRCHRESPEGVVIPHGDCVDCADRILHRALPGPSDL